MNSTRIVVSVLVGLAVALMVYAGYSGAEKLTLVLALGGGCGLALAADQDAAVGTLLSILAIIVAIVFAGVEAGILAILAVVGIAVFTGSAIAICRA